ncbi:MAG: peroxidase-related enzyme [Phycisphaerales bacterium]|nr:peroxidase-related enzyme [Phycisphaerales bacterium]
MPRLHVVDPAQATGRAKEIFTGPLKGKELNIFKGMANSGAALDAYVALSGALAKGGLSKAEQEVIQLAVSEANQCGYCVAAHTVIGKGAGLSDAEALASRRGTPESPRHAALATFARALHEKRGNVADADLSAFRKAGFNDGHIAEAVGVYALATYTNYFNHVNNTVLDFPAPPKA